LLTIYKTRQFWIIAVLRNTAPSGNPRAGASIYGAVQHLMLAARAHGIGATLTTLYSSHEEDVKNCWEFQKGG
jgi:nitroreductase